MRSSARVAALLVLMALVPAVAAAQVPATGPAAAAAAAVHAEANAQGAPSPGPPQGDGQPGDGQAAPGAPKHVVVPATGYGWTPEKHARPEKHLTKGHKQPKGAPAPVPREAGPSGETARLGHHASSRVEAPMVLPGFEMLADGSSRLFVQMSHATTFDARSARGALTYVLKGVRGRRNDYNRLVTLFFNTPVSSAQLVPHGRDLWFVVDLRANVVPSVAMDTTKDGGSMLRIEFPRGSYLAGGAASEPARASAPAPASAPGPAAASDDDTDGQ